jgi:hypothetical protein
MLFALAASLVLAALMTLSDFAWAFAFLPGFAALFARIPTA